MGVALASTKAWLCISACPRALRDLALDFKVKYEHGLMTSYFVKEASLTYCTKWILLDGSVLLQA